MWSYELYNNESFLLSLFLGYDIQVILNVIPGHIQSEPLTDSKFKDISWNPPISVVKVWVVVPRTDICRPENLLGCRAGSYQLVSKFVYFTYLHDF